MIEVEIRVDGKPVLLLDAEIVEHHKHDIKIWGVSNGDYVEHRLSGGWASLAVKMLKRHAKPNKEGRVPV